MSIHDEILGATIFFTPKLDFLFDGDGATVQRKKSAGDVTARDILTVEMVRKAYISDCYAWGVSPGEVPE